MIPSESVLIAGGVAAASLAGWVVLSRRGQERVIARHASVRSLRQIEYHDYRNALETARSNGLAIALGFIVLGLILGHAALVSGGVAGLILPILVGQTWWTARLRARLMRRGRKPTTPQDFEPALAAALALMAGGLGFRGELLVTVERLDLDKIGLDGLGPWVTVGAKALSTNDDALKDPVARTGSDIASRILLGRGHLGEALAPWAAGAREPCAMRFRIERLTGHARIAARRTLAEAGLADVPARALALEIASHPRT